MSVFDHVLNHFMQLLLLTGVGHDVCHIFTEMLRLRSATLFAVSGNADGMFQWSAGVCEVHVADDGRLYSRLSRASVYGP